MTSIREALGVYGFTLTPAGYNIIAVPPGGQPIQGTVPTIQAFGDAVADFERQIRAQLGRPN